MRKNSFFIRFLKFGPIIISFVLTSYIAIHKYSWSKTYINDISGTSIITTVVFYSASSELGFCNLHRNFIIHNFMGTLWIDVKIIFIKEICIVVNIIYVFVFIVLLLELYKIKARHR